MGRPRKKETNVTKILSALIDNQFTTKDLAEKLEMKEGSVRSTLSFLTRAGLTGYGNVNGTSKTFKLTPMGLAQLAKMQEEAA